MIKYGQQHITQSDIDSVISVLQSEYLTQGPMIERFEKKIADYCDTEYALAVNSATSGLHIACLALGLGVGDWLWTTPNTFVASANCGLFCGAEVDFVDIDPQTYNLCPIALEEKLKKAKEQGRLPKIVVPVHLCGQPCDMRTIHKLSKEYGFRIIEDAAHAIGGRYLDEPIGNCKYSDITVFSFHPVKIVTTAEGGMALTNDKELARKMALLRSHGITRSPELMTKEVDGPWYYQQVELGFNYRMTDLQAALGVSQLERLDEYVSRRHEIAQRYNELMKNLPLTLPWQHPDGYSGLHLFVIRLHLDKIDRTHKEVFEMLHSRKILVNLHYIPIHTQPYYEKMGFKKGDFPEAERYYEEAISIPMYPQLTDDQQDMVVSMLKEAIGL